MNFATPVAVTANTIYVASYHTNSGRYSVTRSYFVSAVNSGPLHALAGPYNGVYAYGTGSFPTNSYLSGNYWVDVVLSTPADTTPPTVSSFSPASGATNVATNATVTVTFSEAMTASTINTSTVQLTDGSTAVPASVAYNASNRTATLTPSSALGNSKTYTIVVQSGASGVKDAAGNALATDASSSFTTSGLSGPQVSLWDSTAIPQQIDSGDTQAVELGVKIRSDVAGFITGLRFYKSSANTGTHTGSLWSASGQMLATATFTNETASGWQQVNFATPVAVTANTTYVASYHTNSGHYSVTRSFFGSAVNSGPLHALAGPNNGVYAYGTGSFPTNSHQSGNYWVDVVLSTPADTTPPTVSSFSPASGATNVATNATMTVTFNEAMTASTVNSGTVLLMDGSTAVPASVTYNATNRTATLTPSSALGNSKTYTIVVKSGASGVKDAAGNALAADASSSFTTSAVAAPSVSLWNNTAVPDIVDSGDQQGAELGTMFTSDTSGLITGIKFYKGVANTGTHTASLWTASGQLLATATFTNETASGWQQVTFATPVAITAGTTYVASYHTSGHYSVSRSYFGTPFTSGALHVPVNGGVYRYGAGGFPTKTFQASNYWVDVDFIPAGP